MEIRRRGERLDGPGQRARELLEQLGTPAARQALAKGMPGAGLTQEAKAALQRLFRAGQP